MLFASPKLSRTETISCSSCHNPAYAFADPRPVSIGVDSRSGLRNAPSLANVGYVPALMREGGVPTLEMQVLVPFQEHAEFDVNILTVVEKLQADTALSARSLRAYGKPLDAFVITRAIAAFERTLISGRSRADLGQLSDVERSGEQLFRSARTGCSSCHAGVLYTNHGYANNGALRRYADPGRARLTNKAEDSAVFRIPSLRNVGVTAPYMHNGSVQTLEEVIATYSSGGYTHRNKDSRIRPLHLSSEEQTSIVAFLRSLTDAKFLSQHQ